MYSFKPFGMNLVFWWNPNWSIILVEFQKKNVKVFPPRHRKRYACTFWKVLKRWVVSWLRTPQNVQVLITGTCKYYFTWQKRSGRCSWIQDLKTRGLSQITWGGPKYHHECRYERKAEGNLTWMSRQCDHCSPVLGCYTAGFIEEGGRGQESTHAMNATLEAGKGVKTDSSTEASEERMAWLMPIETYFRLLALRPIRELICVGLNHWVCGNLL